MKSKPPPNTVFAAPVAPSLAADEVPLSWAQPSGIHSTLFSAALVVDTVQSYESMVEELLAQSRATQDPDLRDALIVEAARILMERIGRRDEAQALLRTTASPLARELLDAVSGSLGGLSRDLAALEATATDESLDPLQRADAWVEFGMTCEQAGPSLARALEAYQAALALVPDHPVALDAAAEAATLVDPEAAAPLLDRAIATADTPQMRLLYRLLRAEVEENPARRRAFLARARADDPEEETTLRRLIRAAAADRDVESLGDLYGALAQITTDPVSRATALHLAFLALSDTGSPLDGIVAEMLAETQRAEDPRDLVAPLSEVALHVEREVAIGSSRPLANEIEILAALWEHLDDPRERALVREQMARRRRAQLDAVLRQSADHPLSDDERSQLEALDADLQACLDLFPEHHWANATRQLLLERCGRIPALVAHLEMWARIQPPGPGRAAILLELGRVHEFLRGDGSRAAEAYELALAEAPEDPACLRALGRVYETTRRWPQAVAVLLRQADQIDDPLERPTVLRRVATLAEREMHDPDLAITVLERLVELDADDTLSQFRLAALARANRRTTVLVKTLRQLAERLDDPITKTAVLVELGAVHELRLRQRMLARDYYEQALALAPGYEPALRALGRIYRDELDFEGLAALADPAKQPTADPAIFYYNTARALADAQGYDERVLDLAARAYEANPDLIASRELYIEAASALGRFETAYEIASAQDEPEAPGARADHHYRLGLFTEAACRNADPRERVTLANAALQHYRAAERAQPGHGLAFERARRILVAYGDLENLTAHIAEEIPRRLPENRAAALVQIGRIHMLAGDMDRARSAFERALQVAPEDPIVARTYATLLERTDDHETLPALFLSLAGQTSDAHLRATLLLEAAEGLLHSTAREDRELAAQAILDALRAEPGNPYAVRHLERLLADPEIGLDVRDAVSARAVRAQSDAERATFYLESAELLEEAGHGRQAHRAYVAALDAMPGLVPAQLGIARVARGTGEAGRARVAVRSVHALVAELREAARRAISGDPQSLTKVEALLATILARSPGHRDAVATARAVYERFPTQSTMRAHLERALPHLEDPSERHELARLLAHTAGAPDPMVSLLKVAAAARPDDRVTLEELAEALLREGAVSEAADVRERILELFDPSAPARFDVHLQIAEQLGEIPDHLDRAIEHAQAAATSASHRSEAMALLATLYERAGRLAEAAQAVEDLLEVEDARRKRHDLLVRLGGLRARLGRLDAAIEALERAAALRPGKREPLDMLVDLYAQAGRPEAAERWVEPTRSVLLADAARGALSLRSVRLLEKVAAGRKPDVAWAARRLMHALAPGSVPPPQDQFVAPPAGTLPGWLSRGDVRGRVRAPREPAALDRLLCTLETVFDPLAPEFGPTQEADAAPVPPGVDTQSLAHLVAPWSAAAGLQGEALFSAGLSHNSALVASLKPLTIRIGTNLWMQGDAPAWRGAVALALARHALGARRTRALPPLELDLLLAAAFEVAGVFHPLTADPDPGRLRSLAALLDKHLPKRARRALHEACHELSTAALGPLEAARSTLATDLRVALLLSADLAGTLDVAALMDGAAGGTRKAMVNRSTSAQSVIAYLLGPTYAADHRGLRSG